MKIDTSIPPTIDEWIAYILSEGFYDIKKEQLWAYYENRNWCTGTPTGKFPYGRPMCNWHMLLVQCTKTSREQRKAFLFGKRKCVCGCGGIPRLTIDGRAYASERCIDKVKQRETKAMDMDLAKDLFKKVPDGPKTKPKWVQIQEMNKAQ